MKPFAQFVFIFVCSVRVAVAATLSTDFESFTPNSKLPKASTHSKKGFLDRSGQPPAIRKITEVEATGNEGCVMEAFLDYDSMTTSNYRAEAMFTADQPGYDPFGQQNAKERWYGFRIFIPSDYPYDRRTELVFQWRGKDWPMNRDSTVSASRCRSPNLSLEIKKDQWLFQRHWFESDTIHFGSNPVPTDGSCPPGNGANWGSTTNAAHTVLYSFGIVDKGAWTDWVFHIKWSYKADSLGVITVWKNGTLATVWRDSVGGATAANPIVGKNLHAQLYNLLPQIKWGIYKSPWKNELPDTATVRSRRLFFDNVTMGSETATFADVDPSVHHGKGDCNSLLQPPLIPLLSR